MNEANTNAIPEDVDLPDSPENSMEEDEEEEEESGEDTRETVILSPSVIPTAEEMTAICAGIKEKYKGDVEEIPVKFTFKTVEDKEKGTKTKKDPFEVPLPFLTIQGLVEVLTEGNEKQVALVKDAIDNIVVQAARSIINDDVDFELNAANFPYEKLTWEAIANMPKSERGGGISKEVWEDFAKDYIKVMVEATGKERARIEKAAKLLLGKFNAIKTNHEVISFLVDQLTIYLNATKRADEFQTCVAFLVDKADKLMNSEPADLLEAL